ncbi:hypothetical protein GF371_00860 [Candidatus Woesearchaeota archaeon]|nr:hypothetical protein [Candidatus Woesearchaeota archaeon]
MKLYLMALICVFLVICSGSVIADSMELTVKDLNTNELISDAVCYVHVADKTTAVFPDCESVEFEYEEGDRDVEVIADNPATPGIDYFACFDLITMDNIVYLPPTATLKGIVKDKLDNVVKNADLKFECSRACIDFPSMTDKFGSFSVNALGTGHCKIYANYKDAMGFVSLDLEKGDLKDIEIELDKTVLEIKEPKGSIYEWPIIIAIILVVAGMLFMKYRPRKKKATKSAEVKKEARREERAEKRSKRSEDIIQTLNKKEKQVVEFLMANNNQIHQAKIRHGLGIPRTSLARLVESLQRKKIVSVQKEGKAVRIKLTEWFLGKK